MNDKELLKEICDVLGIGSAARTPTVILTNVRNASRRSACLTAIEFELTTEATDEDGEQYGHCPLNWGADPDKYIEQFRAAIAPEASGADYVMVPREPTDAMLAAWLTPSQRSGGASGGDMAPWSTASRNYAAMLAAAPFNPAPPTSGTTFPAQWFASGPDGEFFTTSHKFAEVLIAGVGHRDEWTITDTERPTPADESGAADTLAQLMHSLHDVLYSGDWSLSDGVQRQLEGAYEDAKNDIGTGYTAEPRAAAQEGRHAEDWAAFLERAVQEVRAKHNQVFVRLWDYEAALIAKHLRRLTSGAAEDAARWRRHDPEIEREAEAIYNAMPYDGKGQKPAWVPHGNSLKQDEARDAARRARGESNG